MMIDNDEIFVLVRLIIKVLDCLACICNSRFVFARNHDAIYGSVAFCVCGEYVVVRGWCWGWSCIQSRAFIVTFIDIPNSC